MSNLTVQELHNYIDSMNSQDKDLRDEARLKVSAWEGDVAPDQIWVVKDNDNKICQVCAINNGKVSVLMMDENDPAGKKKLYGLSSFTKNWCRLI